MIFHKGDIWDLPFSADTSWAVLCLLASWFALTRGLQAHLLLIQRHKKKKKKKCYTPFRETCLFAETYLLFSAAMNKKTSFASFQYLKHIGGKNIQQTLFLKHIFSNSPSHLSCLSCQKMHQCAVVTVVAWIEYVSEKSLSSYFVFLL